MRLDSGLFGNTKLFPAARCRENRFVQSRIRRFLLRRPIQAVMLFADLDLRHHGRSVFASLSSNGEVHGVLSLYRGLRRPRLIALGSSRAATATLLSAASRLPDRCFRAQAMTLDDPEAQRGFVDSDLSSITGTALYGRYVVDPSQKSSQGKTKPQPRAELLRHSDIGAVLELIGREPDPWFDPSWLGAGYFAGIRERDTLVALAGVQALSSTAGVAVIRHLVTRADFRRRGYATACLRALTSAIVRGGQQPVLDLPADDPAGSALAAGAGYSWRCNYHEIDVCRMPPCTAGYEPV